MENTNQIIHSVGIIEITKPTSGRFGNKGISIGVKETLGPKGEIIREYTYYRTDTKGDMYKKATFTNFEEFFKYCYEINKPALHITGCVDTGNF